MLLHYLLAKLYHNPIHQFFMKCHIVKHPSSVRRVGIHASYIHVHVHLHYTRLKIAFESIQSGEKLGQM